MEESRELTHEELEQVIGGQTRESFESWAAKIYALYRKEQNDKHSSEEPAWTGDD